MLKLLVRRLADRTGETDQVHLGAEEVAGSEPGLLSTIPHLSQVMLSQVTPVEVTCWQTVAQRGAGEASLARWRARHSRARRVGQQLQQTE